MTRISTVAPPRTRPDSPYVGLNFYTEEHAQLFFGRDAERKTIIANLRTSRLTLLYAESGVGKSSLLRAGVAPRLRELAERDLAERGAARYIPIVFSSWSEDPTDALIQAIETVVRATAPAIELPRGALDHAIEAAAEALDSSLLIILDQFEEYFLYRSRERRQGQFADELARCVNRPDLRANFLIALREDAYAQLGDLFKGRMPNVYGNYLHLEYLDRAAARGAIVKPIERFNSLYEPAVPMEIEDELVETVLDQVARGRIVLGGTGQGTVDGAARGRASGFVETPYLQLVMKRLWDEEMARGSHRLRAATLESLGGAATIIRTHLDQAMASLSPAGQEAAAAAFRYLVTPTGAKISLSPTDLAQLAEIPPGDVEDLVKTLSGDARILRPVAASGQGDGSRYEIFHDVLAPAVLDWRTRYQRRKVAERARVEAERRERAAQRRWMARIGLPLAGVVLLALAGLLAWALHERSNAQNQAAIDRSNLDADEAIAAVDPALALGQVADVVRESPGMSLDAPPALRPLIEAVGSRSSTGGLLAPVALRSVLARTGFRASIAYPTSHTAALSADGRVVATLDRAGIILRRVPLRGSGAGSPIGAPLRVPRNSVLALSPEGRWLAVSSDGAVRVWDVASRRVIRTIRAGVASFVALSSGRRTLATVDKDGNVRLWNVATGLSQAVIRSPLFSTASIALAPDRRVLAVADSSEVRLLNLKTRRWLPRGIAVPGSVTSVAFARTGADLAIGTQAGTIERWRMGSSRLSGPIRTGAGTVLGVAFGPGGNSIAAKSSQTTVWGREPARRISSDPGEVPTVALNARGTLLADASGGSTVRLWDVRTGKRRRPVSTPESVTSLALSPDGRLLASGDAGGDVYLWDLSSRRRPTKLPSPQGWLGALAFSPDGETLAVGGWTGGVRLWDLASRPLHAKTFVRTPDVRALAFTPGGGGLAVGTGDGSVRLRPLGADARRFQVRTVSAVGDDLSGIAFGEDGETLATADATGVTLWDFSTGKREQRIPVGGGHAPALALAGHTLATHTEHGSIRIATCVPCRSLGPLWATVRAFVDRQG